MIDEKLFKDLSTICFIDDRTELSDLCVFYRTHCNQLVRNNKLLNFENIINKYGYSFVNDPIFNKEHSIHEYKTISVDYQDSVVMLLNTVGMVFNDYPEHVHKHAFHGLSVVFDELLPNKNFLQSVNNAVKYMLENSIFYIEDEGIVGIQTFDGNIFNVHRIFLADIINLNLFSYDKLDPIIKPSYDTNAKKIVLDNPLLLLTNYGLGKNNIVNNIEENTKLKEAINYILNKNCYKDLTEEEQIAFKLRYL